MDPSGLTQQVVNMILRCSFPCAFRRSSGSSKASWCRRQQTTRWALGGGAHALRRRECLRVQARRRVSAASCEPACARAEPSGLLPARVFCGRLRGERACSRGFVAMRQRLCSWCCGADAHLRRVAAGGWRREGRQDADGTAAPGARGRRGRTAGTHSQKYSRQ